MADQPGFWINAIGWFVIALFGLALWTFTRPRPWEKSRITKKVSIEKHRKQVSEAKKWVFISLGCLYCLLFPNLFGLLWLTFVSLLVILGIILALVYFFPKIFKGWSVRRFEEK